MKLKGKIWNKRSERVEETKNKDGNTETQRQCNKERNNEITDPRIANGQRYTFLRYIAAAMKWGESWAAA